MKISLYEATNEDSFSGEPELHVRVLSNDLMDLPRVRAAIGEEQRAIWAGYADKPTYYYPADTRHESHGYNFDDEWHFPKKKASI